MPSFFFFVILLTFCSFPVKIFNLEVKFTKVIADNTAKRANYKKKKVDVGLFISIGKPGLAHLINISLLLLNLNSSYLGQFEKTALRQEGSDDNLNDGEQKNLLERQTISFFSCQ